MHSPSCDHVVMDVVQCAVCMAHSGQDDTDSFFSLAYAAVTQPLNCGIRCCVEGGKTTFKLVYRAAVNDVQHGLGGSTDAQWVVGVAPLMKTGCTSASA